MITREKLKKINKENVIELILEMSELLTENQNRKYNQIVAGYLTDQSVNSHDGVQARMSDEFVSEKMAQIGQRHQVICITHLPQIAAMADSHFEIEKNVEENETVTSIHPLSEEDSVRELARMLGGAKITDSVLANASEMKELAQVQKSARLK